MRKDSSEAAYRSQPVIMSAICVEEELYHIMAEIMSGEGGKYSFKFGSAIYDFKMSLAGDNMKVSKIHVNYWGMFMPCDATF